MKTCAHSFAMFPTFQSPASCSRTSRPCSPTPPRFASRLGCSAKRLKRLKPDVTVGVESRGFIFAAAVADRIGVGFVPVRKPGKLPYKSIRETYALEYGSDSLELHEDAVAGKRCWIVSTTFLPPAAHRGGNWAAHRTRRRQGLRLRRFDRPHVFTRPTAPRPARRVRRTFVL